MARRLSALGVCLLLATMLSAAQPGQSVPVAQGESTSMWFVELASPPTVEGTAVATLEREEAVFHTAAASAGIRYTEGRHFRKLWNGLTVRASAGEMAKVRDIAGVQSVYPVVKIDLEQAETTPLPGADLITAIKMTGADIAQSELGLTGRGVRVAVMDTGIDFNHPDLGGCFGPGCRVEKGFDLVGDAFNADPASPGFNPVPVPDPIPDDCNGHGTHVAGIIGASGGITGVAPRVKFHAYRVFGCEGSTTSDIMLAAMEMVLDDGADVLNMSIGSAYQWPQYPTAKGANQLVKHGVVVVASIGNEGATGLYSAGAPGVGKDVIGVASFDNTHANLVSFTITPDGRKIGYIAAVGAPPAPLTGTFPMARTGTATTTNDACAALPAGSLAGKVVLIRRGTCAFGQKSANAQAAGAAAVVLYNNVPGFISPTVEGFGITIPVVFVSADSGGVINGRLATGPVSMTWTNLVTSEPQPTGGLISSFSSYGLAADLSFKPDVGAPGGTIRSTLPLEQGGYGNLSGTSMSSPHVAGAAALLLEARPDTSPLEVQERIQNTARPHVWWAAPAAGFLDNVHRQGAGMLEIDDAILADAVVSPSSLALGEIEAGSIKKKLTITMDELRDRREGHGRHGGHHHHNDDNPVTYTLGHEPALATGPNTFTPSFFDSFATVTFNKSTVTIGGRRRHDDDSDSLVVTIAPPADADARLFGGYITFTPNDGGTVLRVPYSGYHGDYQAITVLTPTPAGFPWLAKLVGDSLFNQPGGASFTLEGDDDPFILFHLDHQSRRLRMDVIDNSTSRTVGFADDEDFLGRNSSATGFFAFQWDGTTMRRQNGRPRPVPNGSYHIELSILKALGDPLNPAHIERWTSPDIVINRPVPTTP